MMNATASSANGEHAHPAFDEAMAGLNPEQRQAVEQTEGPVMVIAGPGTGKTQILAARIGYILRERDVQPENILCLTYTDAGVLAMRQRLTQFIGPAAHRVHLHTFHSFCNQVIQENPEHFGFRDAEPVSDLDARIVVENLLDGLAAENPLRRFGSTFKATYYDVGPVLRLVELMKKENLDPATLREQVTEYVADLPNNPEFQYKRKYRDKVAGDPKEGAIQDEKLRMDKLLAALDLYAPYNQELREKGWYDFNDMIQGVVAAFSTNENLLRDYQERFQYFLVDEYQDTNNAQNTILNQLVSYWDTPNVFVVGDDDQAIYRFQGANMANILTYWETYINRGLATVVLTRNYRSSQHILDAARGLITNNTERLEAQPGLEINKQLLASNPALAELSLSPSIIGWHNEAHEVVGIARAIQELLESGTSAAEIAVIYRNHKQADPILDYLQALGIPVQLKRRGDLFAAPFTRQVLRVFAYIDDESRLAYSGDDKHFDLLHAGWNGILPRTVAALSWSLRRANDRKGFKKTWREYLGQSETYGMPAGSEDLFRQEDRAQLEAVRAYADRMEEWLGTVRDHTLQGLFEEVIVNGGILRWVLQHDQKTALLEELNTLFDLVKTETARNPELTLGGFMQRLKSYQEHEVMLPVDRSIRTSEGVQFTTAHGAKGLEFEHVFILGADKKHWEGKGRSSGYKLPPLLLGSATEDEEQENRRLFYVAMTRAKIGLTISYAKQTNAGKGNSECRFVAEVAESSQLNVEHKELPEEAIHTYWHRFVETVIPLRPRLLAQETARIAQALERFQLSVTHLNKYLKCPVSFYYENILRIPSAKNRAMTFGSAIHTALESYFKAMLHDPEMAWPSERLLFQWFDAAMHKHREAFVGKQYEQDLERGHRCLSGFVEHNQDSWQKKTHIEVDLSKVVLGDALLRGKLDRIAEEDPQTVIVFDYKTGKCRPEKLQPPTEGAGENDSFEKQYGGDYWRQAVFYKILVDGDQGPKYGKWRTHEAVFEFVEPENDTKFLVKKVPITENDVAIVGDQIKTAWTGIMAQDFDRGCGDEKCRWCSYLKSDSLTRVENASDELVER